MKERNLWLKLKRRWERRLVMTRHECSVTPGTPDVSFADCDCNGWLELKAVEKPKRATTPVLRGKLTPEQINFLQARPHTWLVVAVGKELFMVHGRCDLHAVNTTWTYDDLKEANMLSLFKHLYLSVQEEKEEEQK